MRAGLSGFPSRPAPLYGAATAVAASRPQSRAGANAFAAWLALIGLLIPAAEVQFFVGGAKFTVGRLGILILLVPALVFLCQRGRRLLIPDFFACATACWMIVAGINAAGSDSVSSSFAEAIELLGGYLVARAFFFGPAAIQTFLKVLKILAFAAIGLGTLDALSGTLVTHNAFAALLHVAPVEAQYRTGAVRAASTFDHAILFGAFCSVTAIMLLYSERSIVGRILGVGICFYGCVLSWSSSALISFALALGAYGYDRLMKRNPRRWKLLCGVLAVFATIFFLASRDPIGWIVYHLTLEPESGYFRFMIWEAAQFRISESPLIGFGFQSLNSPILDVTVDSVWLVMALRFGLPMIAFLILTNLTAMLPVRQYSQRDPNEYYVSVLSTGFTMVLVMFMFIGLTVHYWNYLWILWGICIGIRVSLREYTTATGTRLARHGSRTLMLVR